MILYALPHSSYETQVAIVSVFKGGETAFELREPPVRLRTEAYRGVVPMREMPGLWMASRTRRVRGEL